MKKPSNLKKRVNGKSDDRGNKKFSPPLGEVQIRADSKTIKTDKTGKIYSFNIDDNFSSTKGTKKSSSDSVILSSDGEDDEDWNRRISMITYKKPTTGTYSFLASLSGNFFILKSMRMSLSSSLKVCRIALF